MGDISKQLAMKERLQCKSFQWFMEEVAPDLLTKFPELPPNVHWGEVSRTQCFHIEKSLLLYLIKGNNLFLASQFGYIKMFGHFGTRSSG